MGAKLLTLAFPNRAPGSIRFQPLRLIPVSSQAAQTLQYPLVKKGTFNSSRTPKRFKIYSLITGFGKLWDHLFIDVLLRRDPPVRGHDVNSVSSDPPPYNLENHETQTL